MFGYVTCQKQASVDTRAVFARIVGVVFVLAGTLFALLCMWLLATPAQADERSSTVHSFTGSIPGYFVTVTLQDPTLAVDGFYNVTLCPPTSLVRCEGGIYGFRRMSSRDGWLQVSMFPARSTTPPDRIDPRKQLDEAMRTVCDPKPACRGDRQEV